MPGGGNLLVGLIGGIVLALVVRLVLAVTRAARPILDLMIYVGCGRLNVSRVLVDFFHFFALEDFFNGSQIVRLVLTRQLLLALLRVDMAKL